MGLLPNRVHDANGWCSGATALVSLQVGYSVADILAKCGYGFMIYNIARAKMAAEEAVAGSSSAGLAQPAK